MIKELVIQLSEGWWTTNNNQMLPYNTIKMIKRFCTNSLAMLYKLMTNT